jgi:hypothetical protein
MPRRGLVDTNVIIEAVRTGCWRAVAGQLEVETVKACEGEALAGSHSHLPGYVPVTRDDLSRLHNVHVVAPATRAAFKLTFSDADSLDEGEHDLLAFAHAGASEDRAICSPDKAAIRAAVALGLGDRMVSLEEMVVSVGARPKLPLRAQFNSRWLVSFRSKVKLEGL